jgi:hypothetical protein
MQEAKEAAARRGELRLPLPIGYAYDIDGQVVLLHGRKHAPGIGFRLALPPPRRSQRPVAHCTAR